MVLNSDSQLIGMPYGFLRKKKVDSYMILFFHVCLFRWKCLTCAVYDIAPFCNALCSVSLYLFFLLPVINIYLEPLHIVILYERQLVLGHLFALNGSKIIIRI